MSYENINEIRIVNETYSTNAEKTVNAYLNSGWKLLAITQTGNTQEGISTYYTLGRPKTT